jgi:hypothetical protein
MSTPSAPLFRAPHAAFSNNSLEVATLVRSKCRIETPLTSHCVFLDRFQSRLIQKVSKQCETPGYRTRALRFLTQEADFLYPSQIVGAPGALPRVFASVII